jgi:3-hydroxybutyrate dehydrogenase
MSLQRKVALVTGSTSGIGLGIAKELAKSGANIVLNGFGDASEIETLRASIETEYKVKCIYRNADISQFEPVETMINSIIAYMGSLDILVNNAGIQFVASTEEFPVDQWNKIMNINLSGVFYAIKVALPKMKQNGYGRIVNIASAHGLVASKNKIAYVTAKHGVVGMTKVVALEVAEQNITCNAICPGWVLTPLVQKQIDDMAAAQKISVKEAEVKLLGEKQPNLRFATADEIGAMAVYLCSDAARNVTGTTLSIDGGWTAQ